MTKALKPQNYSRLIADLAALIEQGRGLVVRYVNTALVATYWLIGRRIVEHEQKGKHRAEYGEQLLEKISMDLATRFGRGFSVQNLRNMRTFYKLFPIRQTLSGEFTEIPKALLKTFSLSWSHYSLLMRVDEPEKRAFYETACKEGNWSVRQLDRQIHSLLYDRTPPSKRKKAVIAKAQEKSIVTKPEDEIKDPYILEFLNLKDEYSESELEEALIKHLEHFLLELGTGFTFVARQKRITLEDTHYRLDLLFYHRVLKCLVAIDLKLDKFTHADAGQMNLYLNYLKDREKLAGENDPVGIILCTGKKETVVKYALGGMSNQIFTSRYKLQLPDPKTLEVELEHEKQRLLEYKIVQEPKKKN